MKDKTWLIDLFESNGFLVVALFTVVGVVSICNSCNDRKSTAPTVLTNYIYVATNAAPTNAE